MSWKNWTRWMRFTNRAPKRKTIRNRPSISIIRIEALEDRTLLAAPVINNVFPNFGPLAGGTTVNINGLNLNGATAVDFGGVPGTIVTDTANTMSVTSPAGFFPGIVDISVTTPGGTSNLTFRDRFNYVALPTVTAIDVSQGPLAGGTTVTISGTSLNGATSVLFGTIPGTINFATFNSLVVTSPAEAAGTVDITVTTAAGTSATSSADLFTYTNLPIVSSVAPATGPVSGGNTVVINGGNLSGATKVLFGTVPAIISSDTPNSIIVTAPAGALGTVDITVTTPTGISIINLGDNYSYLQPTITNVAPAVGSQFGGTTVFITGTDLQNVTDVFFGTVAGTINPLYLGSPTFIVVTSPAGSLGTVDITVVAPEGTSPISVLDQFTYIAAPVIKTVSPSSGPTSGGTLVTITGLNLQNTTLVDFGLNAGVVVSNTSSTIVVRSPGNAAGLYDIVISTLIGTSDITLADEFTYNATPVSDVLPVAVVTNPITSLKDTSGNIISTLGPSVAVDPANPNKVVEFYGAYEKSNNNYAALSGRYSNDKGATWHDISAILNDFDPTINNQNTPYAVISDVTVVMDRGENVYMIYLEKSTANDVGELIFRRFSFTSNTSGPSLLSSSILQTWYKVNAIYNPTIAVDNNLASFTDTTVTPNLTQTDSMAALITDPNNPSLLVNKSLYVAWDTNFITPNSYVVPGQQQFFNPNTIQVEGSGDGGSDWSSEQYVNDNTTTNSGGNANPVHDTLPHIAFTQGSADGRVVGGQLVFAFDQYGKPSQIMYESSQPDGGVAATPGVSAIEVKGSAGNILDATATAPSPTAFTAVVAPLTDPNFVISNVQVTLDLVHPSMAQVSIQLVSPTGVTVTLLNNQTNFGGTTNPNTGITGSNLGVLPGLNFANNKSSYNSVGTVFDDNAPSPITDSLYASPLIGHFQPEGGFGGGFGGLSAFSGLTAKDIKGTWQLIVTDYANDNSGSPPNPQFVKDWTLRIDSYISSTNFGTDTAITGTQSNTNNGQGGPATGAAGSPYPTSNSATTGVGLSPGLTIAIDNTLGAYSPYEGRFYIAYNNNVLGPTALGTQIEFLAIDGIAPTTFGSSGGFGLLSSPIPINAATGINFDPLISVDPVTGTVGVMYYDGTRDLAKVRVANTFIDSINGGLTWSLGVALNAKSGIWDVATSAYVDAQPIPGNQPQATALGFGEHQGLAIYGGNVYTVFTSNLNDTGSTVMSATVTIAAGPRVLFGDQGPVTQTFVSPDASGTQYNSTTSADGTRQLDGIAIGFDRPIYVASFDASQVTIKYHDTKTALAGATNGYVTIPSTAYSIIPLDNTGPFGVESNYDYSLMAQTFLIKFSTPQNGVGTYSYVIGNLTGAPLIKDGVKSSTAKANSATDTDTTTVSGNKMDQNQDAFTGESAGVPSQNPTNKVPAAAPTTPTQTNVPPYINFNGDVFAVPTPINGIPFVFPYQSNSSPIIIPGPYLTQSSVPSNPLTADNTVLDKPASTLNLTFDRLINPTSFTTANILRVQGPTGTINSYSNTTSAVIPDGTGQLDSTITVTDSLAIYDLAVGINITHANVGDLSAVLVAPDGTQVKLFTNLGGATANYTNTIFDDHTTNLLKSGTAPFSAIFKPQGLLSTLNGKNFQGTWHLLITDNTAGNAGTLNSWTLNPFTVTPINPLSGLATTNPTTTFQIGFPTQVISGTYTFDFGTGTGGNLIQDTNGFAIDSNHNAGVELINGGSPLNGTVVTNTYPSGTINTVIPATSTITSTLNVPASFAITSLNLQLSIQHAYIPDLTAFLTAPDGTSTEIFSNEGVTGSFHANFTNTTFSDSATTPISQAVAVANTGIGAGPYLPQFPLAKFKSINSTGNWKLTITSNSSSLTGKLVNWSLIFTSSIPGSGLGQPVIDEFTTSFRIFNQDPTNSVSQQNWTAVGPTPNINVLPTRGLSSGSQNTYSGSVTAIAVDPSDPTGNTVFAAGASGGVWKTSDFLTNGGYGPTWIPLTDLGPGYSLNTSSLAVLGRNNDPLQSIIFASTGNGAYNTPGVGVLRSLDGGKTWNLLDSTTNVDTTGNILPITDPGRDHLFVGTSTFKVVVDPKPTANGQAIVYLAVSGTNGGIYRSVDSGGSWKLLQAGNASDVTLAPTSADSKGFLEILYGAISGVGVFFTSNALNTASMSLMGGGQGHNTYRNTDPPNPPLSIPVTVGNLSTSPNGANGNIVLAVPALTGNALEDSIHEGWLYAAVTLPSGPDYGKLQGVYLTKDFGANWTLLQNITYWPNAKNTLTEPEGEPVQTKQGIYSVISLAVDPNNAAILYLGGASAAVLRIDTTTISDPYSMVAFDSSLNDGGQTLLNTSGDVTLNKVKNGYGLLTPGTTSTVATRYAYVNLLRDPNNPFNTNTSLQFTNVVSFKNSGDDVQSSYFTGGGLIGENQHTLFTMKDPLTGKTTLLFGNDFGISMGTDDGAGNSVSGFSGSPEPLGSRNGNIQLAQFYYGAAQPSILAAQLAGAMFYGMSQSTGFPQSTGTVIETGNTQWNSTSSSASSTQIGIGVATDQTGGGTLYQNIWPCCIYDSNNATLPSDFFQVTTAGSTAVSRTTGLLQAGDDPESNLGQWSKYKGSNFAVNPIDPTTIAMSSQAGRIFMSSGPITGYGKQWFVIADPTDLDGTYVPAIAFGSPSTPSTSAPLDNFIYAGTTGGKIYVTSTGGAPWTDISAGLDGATIQQIVTNPNRGSHEAYAVTATGVFYMADSLVAGATWTAITGNLFSSSLTRTLFNDPSQSLATLKTLTSVQADWRYAIPDNLSSPSGATHPVLYVSGDGGVYRSLDKGLTWTYFPDVTVDGAYQAGGFLPSVNVRSLSLSVGNLNPSTGLPDQQFGLNLLYAATFGQGSFAIRLSDSILLSDGSKLSAFAVAPTDGPHVTAIQANKDVLPNTLDGVQVTFSGPVDPATFSASKILTMTDPNGVAIPVGTVTEDIYAESLIGPNASYSIYDINFITPQTTFGFYHVSFGPNISDFGGNMMDQNQNFTNGETPGDIFAGRFLFQNSPNKAPVLNTTTTNLGSENEDIPLTSITGVSVATFVNALTAPGITDADSAGYVPTSSIPIGIAVTNVDNTNGTWQFSLDNGTTWTNFGTPTVTQARLLDAKGGGITSPDMIRYLPNANTSGVANFTFQAWDETSGLNPLTGMDGGIGDAGISGGSSAFSSTSSTGFYTVNFINDQPSFTSGGNVVANENVGAVSLPWATNISADSGFPAAGNESGQALNFILTNTNSALFATQPSIDPKTGNLTFKPALNASGVSTVTLKLHDNGGTLNGGIDTSATVTFTITVRLVNQAPTFTAGPNISVGENVGAQTITAWATNLSAGPPNESTQTLNFIVTNSNNSLFSVQPAISSNGTLTFTAAANQTGIATVTVQLHDSGGVVNGGNDTSAPITFKITVSVINQAPSFTKGPDVTVLENSSAKSIANWATAIAAGPANESSQIVNFLVTNNNNSLFSAQPTISSTGTLTFTPAANQYGTATVTVKLHDNGGVVSGGVDTSAAQTFTITVSPVNQVPSFKAGANQTVLEGAGAQSVANWATTLSAGPANESSQTLSFIVTNSNNSLFSAQPAISPTGTLTYTPASGQFGTATVTVKIHDNGGVANGGVDTSVAQTFTITVTQVNQVPFFTVGPNVAVLENVTAQSIANWATGISAGAVNESAQTLNFIVTNSNNALFSAQPAISPTGTLTFTPAANQIGTATVSVKIHDNGGVVNGGKDTSVIQTFTITVALLNHAPSFTAGTNQTTLENASAQSVANWASNISAGLANESGQLLNFVVTNNNNSLFSAQPTISPTGTLTYTPATNQVGTATVTVKLHDNGGTISGGVDTSASQTFTITVTPVNQVPSFKIGANQTITQNSLAQSIASFATNISAGPANESTQALNFLVTNSNNNLFSTQPSISPTGTLTFTPATNQVGTATVSVQIHDNGGITNGGKDTSAIQTFTITIVAVNQVPSFTKGADISAAENISARTYPNWATNISAGPANESTQTVNFIVTNSNNTLFSVQPTISPTGTLTFTPAKDQTGSATVSVQIHDNGGGTDTSAIQTFTITVSLVNHVPSFTVGSNQVVGMNSLALTIPNFATNISAGPNESSQTVSFIVANNNPNLFATMPSIAPNGTLTYTPAANVTGTATVSVQIQDNGGTANGGVDTSMAQTFTITIQPINQAPSFTKGADQAVNVGVGVITIKGWATGITVGPTSENGQIVHFIVTSDNANIFAIQPTISPTGDLSFAPSSGTVGKATVTVTLQDNGGTAFKGHDTSALQTFTITVSSNTKTTLTLSSVAPVYNQAITLTAQVIPDSGKYADLVGQTVTFYDGTKSLGTGKLDATGKATLTPTLAVTPSNVTSTWHQLSVKFVSAVSYYNGSASSVHVTPVYPIATTASEIVPATGTFGQALTLKALITAASDQAGLKGGIVKFYDGTKLLNTTANPGVLDATGNTSITISDLAIGDHYISINYSNSNYLASSTGLALLKISKAGTTSTLTLSPTSANFGESIKLTTVVVPSTGTASDLKGVAVTFMDGANVLGKGTLDSTGSASMSTNSLAVGPHTVTAVLAASSNFVSSTGTAKTVISKAGTVTTLTVPSSSAFNQSVTLTATVKPKSGSISFLAGEMIKFMEGTNVIGTATLNASGVASFSTSSLPIGSHSFTAAYAGDSNFNASSSSKQTLSVGTIGTTTTLTVPTIGYLDQSVTFTARVTPNSGTTPLTGTVQFMEGTTNLGTPQTLVSGAASYTTSALPLGGHTLTAVFTSSNSNYAGSASATQSLTISKLPTSLNLSPSVIVSSYGQSIKVDVTVAHTLSPKDGSVPTGTVTITIDGTPTTLSLIQAHASLTLTSLLQVGNHTIKVGYNGDTNYLPISTTLSQDVNKAGTTTTLATPSFINAGTTLTATVASVVVGGPAPQGAVTFFIDGNSIGTGTLDSNGVATLSNASVTPGNHTFSASYVGNSFYTSSTSLTQTQTVPDPNTVTALQATLIGQTDTTSMRTFTVRILALNSQGNEVGNANGTYFTSLVSAPTGGSLTPKSPLQIVNGGVLTTFSVNKPGTYTFNITFAGITTQFSVFFSF